MTEKYGIKEMVNDFVNPAQYTKTSELADKGVLTIVSTTADESEEYGKSYKTTLKGDSLATDTVTVTMGGTNITATAYTAATGVVKIGEVTGNIVITVA